MTKTDYLIGITGTTIKKIRDEKDYYIANDMPDIRRNVEGTDANR